MSYGTTSEQIAQLLNAHNRLQNPVDPYTVERHLDNYVVEKDGNTVTGCAEIVERAWYMAEICHFVVAPGYRRNPFRFIRLLKKTIAQAHIKYPVLCATVRDDNGPMIRGIFRLALGFKPVGKFQSRISGKPVHMLFRINQEIKSCA